MFAIFPANWVFAKNDLLFLYLNIHKQKKLRNFGPKATINNL